MARIVLAAAHALCLLTLVVPPSLLMRAAPARANDGETARAVPPQPLAANVERLERSFAAEAVSEGLTPMGPAQAELIGARRDGGSIVAVSTAASAPLSATAARFFWRRTTVVLIAASGAAETVSTSELQVGYVGSRVTLTFADRFTPAIDRLAAKETNLAGVEVRRSAAFDSANLEVLAARQMSSGAAGAGAQQRQAELRGELDARNYEETVTIVAADGTQRAYPAGAVDLNAMLGMSSGGGAELTIGCLTQCFEDNGGTLGLAGAICLVAGLVVCVGACAVSAGIACIPCIGGAGTFCGLVIAGGSLGACIAICINASYVPPAPTPTPVPGSFFIEVAPFVAAAGYEVHVRWSAPAGHGGTDWVGLYVEGAANPAYLAFEYLSSATSGELTFTAPSTPGRYELRVLLDDGYVEPNPARRASLLVGAYSMSLRSLGAPPGREIEVDWTAPADHSARDWIGLYTLGTSNPGYRDYEYLTGGTAGTVSFLAPPTPGPFELRLLLRDGYTEPGPPVRRLVFVASCPLGDCDVDGAVTVEETTRMVALRIGAPGGAGCGASTTEGGDEPSMEEITAAVGYALTGCGDGRTCGAERPCEAYQICDRVDPSCSGTVSGMCELRPFACLANFDPVCGCDGVTYSNDCRRRAAGAVLRTAGACPGGRASAP